MFDLQDPATVDLQPHGRQGVAALHLQPGLKRDLPFYRIGHVDPERGGLHLRAPQQALAHVHLAGVLGHPDVLGERRHRLGVVCVDGAQVAVEDVDEAGPIAGLVGGGVPGGLLSGDGCRGRADERTAQHLHPGHEPCSSGAGV